MAGRARSHRPRFTERTRDADDHIGPVAALLCPSRRAGIPRFGFEWQPIHSQRLYELAKINYRDYLVSPWILRALGYQVDPQPDEEIGMPYIHGVEPKEGPLHRPLLNFEGGTCIAGTTQSGKGVALSVLVSQAVYRGDDVVIIFDPKNSSGSRVR